MLKTCTESVSSIPEHAFICQPITAIFPHHPA